MRRTRIKAAELAAQIAAGREIDKAQLFALCVFFESWIDLGGDETERRMHLFRPRKVRRLKVVAGGKL